MNRNFFLVGFSMVAVLLGVFLPAAFGEEQGIHNSSRQSMLLGAHRAGKGQWPENTLVAISETARRWPGALIETDAQTSVDGQVILLHDTGVERTTNGSGVASLMTFAALRDLDAAWNFTTDRGVTHPYRAKGVVIPTLREALHAAPDHPFLIELKDGDNVAAAAAAVIREAGAEKRCYIASVNPALLAEFKAVAPEIPTSYDVLSAADLLAALRENRWEPYLPQHRMLALSPALKKQFNVSREEMSAIRQKGILLAFFTVNDQEDMRELLDMGVDSIITDYPDRLAALLK